MEYYEFKKEDAYEFVRVSGIQSKQRGDELQLLFCPYCRGGKNGDKGTFSISLVTGQFKCLRSSCSGGSRITYIVSPRKVYEVTGHVWRGKEALKKKNKTDEHIEE